MTQRITRIRADLRDLIQFHNISISPLRHARLHEFYTTELASLTSIPKSNFKSLDQQSKVDYLLLKNFLEKGVRQLEFERERDEGMKGLLGSWAGGLVGLCEGRQAGRRVEGGDVARRVWEAGREIEMMSGEVSGGKFEGGSGIETENEKGGGISKSSAFRAANTIQKLRGHLKEWFGFYKGYDPLFTWWVKKPYERLDKAMDEYTAAIREFIVGIKPGDTDAIVGEPIGREGLLVDLKAEMIPYSPEEIISIGEKEYVWCLKEMKKASSELGYENWKDALEYVKTLYVPPGEQTQLVRFLAEEAIEYVKTNDLVTVPRVAEESWRMFMMSPQDQKVNPFFLGGDDIIVSYPDDSMGHEEKMMSMRGNNIHFSRSTVFHEMIPGHHLQFHMIARYKAYRQMFDTAFWMEGWALYWEMILWDKKFPKTAENRIGMLFWRMHRCARIIFSVKFHLGLMTPQECIDMLVDMVGHERENAEGEVRRSFNGDYTPLYQAGYMLGALQLYSLREEVVGGGLLTEKQFHDRVMKENEMPIEMLRALITGQDLNEDYETSWRFYREH
ncbi:X-Pro dipeptidyl-peptidase [Cadophora sp. MPI-SDFR-AT-0126]|nr:X-Pro dipeptidyl-peptidase [Leotiomycetes sp. MPI-SDFR-AT-0126]